MTIHLLDTCIIYDLMRGFKETIDWLSSLNREDSVAVSGWTVLELLKEKKSKKEMDKVLLYFQQYQIFWPEARFCQEAPRLLKEHFHSQRTKKGKLKGSAVFDVMIYLTVKSNNLALVTRDNDFDFADDVKVIKLKKK